MKEPKEVQVFSGFVLSAHLRLCYSFWRRSSGLCRWVISWYRWIIVMDCPFHSVPLAKPGLSALGSAEAQNKVCRYKSHHRLQAMWQIGPVRRVVFYVSVTWFSLRWNPSAEWQDDPKRRIKQQYLEHFIQTFWILLLVFCTSWPSVECYTFLQTFRYAASHCNGVVATALLFKWNLIYL